MRVVFELTSDELNNLQYPIIVESWERSMGSMRFKCEYKKAFTEQERKHIRCMYNDFYRWHLVTGTPKTKVYSMNAIHLIKRAVMFFAMS